MWNPLKKAPVTTQFDEQITRLLLDMAKEPVATEKYKKDLESLEKLNAMRLADKPALVSKDTLVQVGGYLVGILVFVGFEQKHMFTSKGLSQLNKFR